MIYDARNDVLIDVLVYTLFDSTLSINWCIIMLIILKKITLWIDALCDTKLLKCSNLFIAFGSFLIFLYFAWMFMSIVIIMACERNLNLIIYQWMSMPHYKSTKAAHTIVVQHDQFPLSNVIKAYTKLDLIKKIETWILYLFIG